MTTKRIALWILALAIAAPAALLRAQQGEEDPIQKLKEIQKLMSEIETDLAKATLGGKVQADEEWVRDQIDKLIRSGASEAEVSKRLQELFQKSGKNAAGAQAEIERLMKAMADAKSAGEKMEKVQEEQERVSEELLKLFKALEKATESQQKLDKMFQECEGKQKEVTEGIQHLIDTAKKMQMQGQGQPQEKKEEEEGQEGEKPENQEQAKNPEHNQKDQPERIEKDRTDYEPPESPDDPSKDSPPDKADRWGDLLRRQMERGRTAGKESHMPGYDDLVNEYFRRIWGASSSEDKSGSGGND